MVARGLSPWTRPNQSPLRHVVTPDGAFAGWPVGLAIALREEITGDEFVGITLRWQSEALEQWLRTRKSIDW
jgi:hypothetical protein